MAKLIKAKHCIRLARTAKEALENASISMLFHTLNANADWVADVSKKELPQLLTPKHRPLMALEHKGDKWMYSKEKCNKTLELLGLEFGEFDFDDFIAALTTYLKESKEEKTEEEKIAAANEKAMKKLMKTLSLKDIEKLYHSLNK